MYDDVTYGRHRACTSHRPRLLCMIRLIWRSMKGADGFVLVNRKLGCLYGVSVVLPMLGGGGETDCGRLESILLLLLAMVRHRQM